MTIKKLSADDLAENPEILRTIIGRRFRMNSHNTGTFIEGSVFPETFRKYAIVFPRGGAIVPNIKPAELGGMISWGVHFRFHWLREKLEKDLLKIFEVPVQLGFSIEQHEGYWKLSVSSPTIPADWWNDDCGPDELLTECFFHGSVDPLKNFWDIENWKRHINKEHELQEISKTNQSNRRQREHAELEAFLADPTRSLKITMFISSTKSQVVMDMTGTPVQLLQHVFENAWMWGQKLDVYKRGFRFQLNGIGRKEDWIFYTSVDDLRTALKSRWPAAYDRAEMQQH